MIKWILDNMLLGALRPTAAGSTLQATLLVFLLGFLRQMQIERMKILKPTRGRQ
jgi:hypothetical protein